MVIHFSHKSKTRHPKVPKYRQSCGLWSKHSDWDGPQVITPASPFARKHSQRCPGLTVTNQASGDTWGERVWVKFTAATMKKGGLYQVTGNPVGLCPTNLKGRKEPRVIRFCVSV